MSKLKWILFIFGVFILLMIFIPRSNKKEIVTPKEATTSAVIEQVTVVPTVTKQVTIIPVKESKVTLDKFNRISEGMTYEQVVEILGSEGEVMSSSDMAGYKTVLYTWKGDSFSNMNAMFQNGKMISKAQFGLK